MNYWSIMIGHDTSGPLRRIVIAGRLWPFSLAFTVADIVALKSDETMIGWHTDGRSIERILPLFKTIRALSVG